MCDEVAGRLRSLGVSFDTVDISKDAGLQGEYGKDVPVVELAGVRIFEAGESLENLLEAQI